MTNAEDALKLQDAATLWSAGLNPASDVVMAACHALVAGLDGPALQILASVSVHDAGYDLPDYLPAALEEQSLEHVDLRSVAGQEAAVGAMARRLLAGKFSPRLLAFHVHQAFGHELPIAEGLAALDDQYDMLESGDSNVEQIDAQVIAEAHRIVDAPPASRAEGPRGNTATSE
jgi:hypothetical protein